jgi:hypothetical protein
VLHGNVNVLVMWVAAFVGSPYSGPVGLIQAAADASIGNYVLYPRLQAQFQPQGEPSRELIRVETTFGVVGEVSGADDTVAGTGIVVGNAMLVCQITDGAVIFLVPLRRNPVYLPEKSLKAGCSEAISDSPHIKPPPTH